MTWATSDRSARLPADWKQRRAVVKQRAGGQCQWTTDGVRCAAVGVECDHSTPGDDHSLSNLQWLCRDHHAAKTQAEARAARPTRRRAPEPHPNRP